MTLGEELLQDQLDRAEDDKRELTKMIVALRKQLNERYGCESCPGLPALSGSKDVAAMALKAAFFDVPEIQNMTTNELLGERNDMTLQDRLRVLADYSHPNSAEHMHKAADWIDELEKQRRLWLDTDITARTLVDQEKEITALKSDLAHWKSNHATVVAQARILKERDDMPIERVKAYEKWQETEAKCVALAAQNQEMRDSIANLLRNKHADECWLILSVDCIRLEELLKNTNQGTSE